MVKAKIEKRIAEVKAQLSEQTGDAYYVSGLLTGLRNVLACPTDKITAENLEEGRAYYARGNGGGLSYRQGIMDAYEEVKSMLEEV